MENFVVSARKYRPATFASVVGQRHITSTLKNAIERGQLAHAYLFCGPRGVGKTTCARIFAKAINCLNPQSGEACNECESCRSFNEGRSLNVHELDAASNNSVDDIRNLIEQVRIIPQVGRYSVFVIDEVHMLSAAAFNAFLKTLEEPPQHAIFILATTEKHKIIPTILSRCQIYDFNRIRVEDGVEYLKYIAQNEGVTADDEALNLIAHKADGGMRDALSMFDKAVSFCGENLNYKDVAATLNVLDYDTYFQATDLLLEGRYVDVLMLFDNVLSRGFSPQVFLSGLNAHFRDLLMSKGPAITLVEFTGTLVERYKQQAAKSDETFLFNAISLLTEADGKIRQSSNQRLLVELGLMKIAGLGQKKNGEVDTFATDIALPPLQSNAQACSATPTGQPAPQTVAAAQPAVEPRVAQQSRPIASVARPTEAVTTTETKGVIDARGATEATEKSGAAEAKAAMEAKAATEGKTTAEAKAAMEAKPTSELSPSATATRPMGQSRVQPSSVSISLSQLVSGGAKTATDLAREEAEKRKETAIDPDCETKLLQSKDRFIENLAKGRQRLSVPFRDMTVSGNVVKVVVASRELHDEIMRDKSELQRLLSEVSGAYGFIDIAVTINERIKVNRPITIEDKLKHMLAQNDRLPDMIERLFLDVE